MKDRKELVPVLVVIALLVWGWNFWSLFNPGEEQTLTLEELPEIPKELMDEVLASELPELARDPFLAVSKKPDQKDKPADLPPGLSTTKQIPPPNAHLLLIQDEAGVLLATFEVNEPEPRVLKEGDKIGDWTIQTITMETVSLLHQDGKSTHRFSMF